MASKIGGASPINMPLGAFKLLVSGSNALVTSDALVTSSFLLPVVPINVPPGAFSPASSKTGRAGSRSGAEPVAAKSWGVLLLCAAVSECYQYWDYWDYAVFQSVIRVLSFVG